MLLIERRIWSAQAATVNTTFESVEPELVRSLSYILTFAGTNFTGTIDIQGREANPDAWANIPYRSIDGGVGPLTPAQIVLAASSERRRYLIPIAPTQVRLVLTRSAGSIDAWVRGSASPIPVTVGGGVYDYYVLSTEPRPGNLYFDAATTVATGATLFEYDTGGRFVYAGSQRGWISLSSPDNGTVSLLERILHELTLLRLGHELVLLDEHISEEG